MWYNEVSANKSPRANVGISQRTTTPMTTSNDTIPYGYCHCGCGQEASLARKTDKRKGHIKGQPLLFVSGHQNRVNSQPKTTINDRFLEKVNKNGAIPAHRPELGRCWEWTGFVNKHGYGSLRYGSEQRANRISWILYYGQIPDNLFVLHKCDNPSCVNPKHLFLGTQLDNVRDMIEKGRKRNKGSKK